MWTRTNVLTAGKFDAYDLTHPVRARAFGACGRGRVRAMSEVPAASEPPAKRAWLEPESRSRRLIFGLGIYLACLAVFALVAGDG